MDDLLLWLSAKSAGSWSQFRAAVEELHVQRQAGLPDDSGGEHSGSDLPVYHEARFALQRLAHVEFLSGGSGHAWRVVPPSLALVTSANPFGLLCGARSTALLERLRTVVGVEMSPIEGGPQRVVLHGDSEAAIAARARDFGLHVQESAPIALLCAIPAVRDVAKWSPTEMPVTPGWTVHRFSPSGLQWIAVSQEETAHGGTALFRFVMKHQRSYYLRWRGRSYRVPVQVGKYAVMGKRHAAISYDAGRRAFSFPAVCRPPLLIERALVLCSGVLPHFDPVSARVEYAEIPRDIVRLAAQLLCQEVR